MHNSSYFTGSEALISDLSVGDMKAELNVQRNFYIQCGVTELTC